MSYMSPMGKVPWGDDVEIEWDEENEAHIAEHGVKTWEVDELIHEGEYETIRHPKWRRRGAKFKRRYLLTGRTLGGRTMLVVVDKAGPGRLRPVTAWDNI